MKKPQSRNETGVVGLSANDRSASVDRAGNISADYASASFQNAADIAFNFNDHNIILLKYDLLCLQLSIPNKIDVDMPNEIDNYENDNSGNLVLRYERFYLCCAVCDKQNEGQNSLE